MYDDTKAQDRRRDRDAKWGFSSNRKPNIIKPDDPFTTRDADGSEAKTGTITGGSVDNPDYEGEMIK